MKFIVLISNLPVGQINSLGWLQIYFFLNKWKGVENLKLMTNMWNVN